MVIKLISELFYGLNLWSVCLVNFFEDWFKIVNFFDIIFLINDIKFFFLWWVFDVSFFICKDVVFFILFSYSISLVGLRNI